MTDRHQRRQAKITSFVCRVNNIPSTSTDGCGRNNDKGGKTRCDFRDSNIPSSSTDSDERNNNIKEGKTRCDYHDSNAEVCTFHDLYIVGPQRTLG